MAETPENTRIRATELIASACLATDLGMGFPFEHGLHATLMTMRLAELCDVGRATASHAYHASLLMYSGCTVDADLTSRLFGGSMRDHITPVQFGSAPEGISGVIRAIPRPDDPPHLRAYEIARRLPKAASFRASHFGGMCEVATMLAERLGVPAEVPTMFAFLTERWDGKGVLRRARGEEIPLPLRIVHVARDMAYQRVVGGEEHAIETVRRRAGHAFDPAIVDVLVSHAPEIMSAADSSGSAWDATLAAEPQPWVVLGPDEVDRGLAAIGDFADLSSPFLSGHSSGVADLAAAAAAACGLGADDVSLVRRSGWVHDVGRVAVHPRIWQKPAPLNADEWEQVRLHAYHTERVTSRSPVLAPLAAVGCTHHERMDGSGYHRRLGAASLAPPARVLAATDVFRALVEPRPYREALTLEEAGRVLDQEARAGRLDPVVVAALLEGAGQRPARVERPAGLTEREVEVMGLIARGLQTKQVARALAISIKTADRHIQNAYRKTGVSSRAAATMFAMEHGLVPWGGLPMSPSAERS